ncbi:PTS IIA-like nitrogen regulatory protein PtsN [Lichenihabitans psoromatis]|uniref:PTS IIA-like nitrogen regulatory protein PtsN n=1 Tax=Lichenihabitans psoromatis TaxID=2528642 RepID=UPI001038593E|nr:PTS IIA-like nitrogen regulatory protein PtsN [Lichenihabitans psoromatis]
MALTDLISAAAIIPALRANTKKTALQDMSERAATVSGLPARDIYDAVLQREKLGSTGVGKGVAIPHGKLATCGKIFGVFARLERPIEFDALDGEPVDLAFLLVAPESAGADHLKALAKIARVLREPHVTTKLRAARDAASIYAIIMSDDLAASHAA